MRLSLPMTLGVAVILAAAACGGPPPPAPPPQPNADSIEAARRAQARADSIAGEQARRDSIARAEAERDRIRRQREADSLAALRSEPEAVREMLARRVNFDFDRSNIRPRDAQVLDQKLAILQANPALNIEIAGHCDERGSDEYNLALGNRRALSAKQYLTSRGIADNRVSTRSFGEERPMDQGSNEAAWEQNRRDEFTITAGGNVLKRPGM